MTPPRRLNVDSGRRLESLAHYSRALRVGDTVLQSGTTAIDRQGNVRGEGDVVRQVEAIMRIAEWSMGMVDVPVYKRAQVIMARARAVADTERRKAEALSKNA